MTTLVSHAASGGTDWESPAMAIDQRTQHQDDRWAGSIETRLRRSVRYGIWKGVGWRTLLVVLGFVLLGSALLQTANRLLPAGALQSPVVVFSVTALMVGPLVIFAVRHVLALAVNLEIAHLEVLSVLGNAIAKRDDATQEHNQRVAVMAARLAMAIGLDRRLVPGLFTGAFLHDIGKIGISDRILLKPGQLTAQERQEMERHVVYGEEILAGSPELQGARRVVLFHHERFDGGGYPEGRKGNEIPPEARLFAIVDVFDALTSSRPYKGPMGLEEALGLMESERGKHFDPVYLDAFKAIAGALYTELVLATPKRLRELGLELIEHYYTVTFPGPAPQPL